MRSRVRGSCRALVLRDETKGVPGSDHYSAECRNVPIPGFRIRSASKESYEFIPALSRPCLEMFMVVGDLSHNVLPTVEAEFSFTSSIHA